VVRATQNIRTGANDNLASVGKMAEIISYEFSLILEDSCSWNLCHQVFSMAYDWH